jgi:hypothetical protein
MEWRLLLPEGWASGDSATMGEREGNMRKSRLILIACLTVAAGQCWADEDEAQAPPDPAVFCYLKGKAYSEGAVEKSQICERATDSKNLIWKAHAGDCGAPPANSGTGK